MAQIGKNGGLARAKKMTPEQRSESARKAITSRWSKADQAQRAEDEEDYRESMKVIKQGGKLIPLETVLKRYGRLPKSKK